MAPDLIGPNEAYWAGLLEPVRALQEIVHGLRESGHLAASLDPLGLHDRSLALDWLWAGVDRVGLGPLPAALIAGPLGKTARSAEDALSSLVRTYCGTTGYEYMHIRSAAERGWFQSRIEGGHAASWLSAQASKDVLERLIEVDAFERSLHKAFPGQYWFSLEGLDVLVPVLDLVLEDAAAAGMDTVVLGMAHRGRLNVLGHIMGVPYEDLFASFQAPMQPESGSGGWSRDVRYHQGAEHDWTSLGGQRLHLFLPPNPSHLEMISPVVLGMVRACQDGHPGRCAAAMAVLVNGDAAFAGQGVVAEALNLAGLQGYTTGGALHIIANNQVGFTTEPRDAMGSVYCTDIARGLDIPVVHVNADDPEACLAAVRLCLAYRQQFHKDAVLDLVGYRRYGHNEGDDPTFTQPRVYGVIATHPPVHGLWRRRLEEAGVVAGGEYEAMLAKAEARLREAAKAPAGHVSVVASSAETSWPPVQERPRPISPLTAESLRELNDSFHAIPEGFKVHPRLERVLERRRSALDGAAGVDWGHAETLAFGTIVQAGIPVRLSGQDTQRGTFSQRHAVWWESTGADTSLFWALARKPASPS